MVTASSGRLRDDSIHGQALYAQLGRVVIYFAISAFFFIVTVVGWHLLPNSIWGLYTLTDGALAAWNSTSMLVWTRPFDISPYNILQGLGSLYIPNTPWFNPGALVMSLPVALPIKYYLSYSVYLIELLISTVILCRVLGLSAPRAVTVALLLCLIIFPPYTNYFFTLPWISLAPFNAHLIAIANLLLALFTLLGKRRTVSGNLALISAFVLLVACAFYSAAVTFITYIPVYALFAVAIMVYEWRERTCLRWRLALIAAAVLLGLALRVPDFYVGTMQVTSSHSGGTQAPKGIWETAVILFHSWKSFRSCDYPMVAFCSSYPIFYVHLAGLIGALISFVFYRGLPRYLGLTMLLLVLLQQIYAIGAEAHVLGIFNRINKDYLVFSSYTFYALFTGFALFTPLDYFRRSLATRDRFSSPLAQSLAGTPWLQASHLRSAFALVELAIVPIFATWIMFQLQGPQLRQILSKGRLPPVSIQTSVENAITSKLQQEAGLIPGEAFKGYTTTYFGSNEGPLRKKIGFGEQSEFSNDIYINSRFYMQALYGNSFTMTDLWGLNIPTLNEYGQWITQPLFVFMKEVLASQGDRLFPAETNLFRLNLSILQSIGLRFIITDALLSDNRLKLRASLKLPHSSSPARPEITMFAKAGGELLKGDPVPVNLYELLDSNLASYSPSKVSYAFTAKETLLKLNDADFSPREEVLVNEQIGNASFVSAQKSRMEVIPDGVRVIASSPGTSILLLPIQFSRCLNITSHLPRSVKQPHLARANLVATALVFERQVDADLSFNFGPGSSAGCRLADVADYKKLDFSPWGF